MSFEERLSEAMQQQLAKEKACEHHKLEVSPILGADIYTPHYVGDPNKVFIKKIHTCLLCDKRIPDEL